MNVTKTVHVLPDGSTTAFEQSLYLDRESMTLIPNLVFIDERGGFLFETNSLGLRGREPEPDEPIAVAWGDSTVFCLSTSGWPEQINDDGVNCLFLNGGIEGANYREVLKRALEFNSRKNVALNIVLPGWLPFPDNAQFGADLAHALTRLQNPVIVTQPTALNAQIAGTDISASFAVTRDEKTMFRFWSQLPYSVEDASAYFSFICRRNAIATEVAHAAGVPVIDLFAHLDTTGLSDFREYFFDITHPRSIAYPKIAKFIRDAVRPLLRPAGV
jgi:hypothetical protein